MSAGDFSQLFLVSTVGHNATDATDSIIVAGHIRGRRVGSETASPYPLA